MRTANAKFDTTSGNPVGLSLPRNCLRGRPEPLSVKPVRNQRRALEEEATCLAFISIGTCDLGRMAKGALSLGCMGGPGLLTGIESIMYTDVVSPAVSFKKILDKRTTNY